MVKIEHSTLSRHIPNRHRVDASIYTSAIVSKLIAMPGESTDVMEFMEDVKYPDEISKAQYEAWESLCTTIYNILLQSTDGDTPEEEHPSTVLAYVKTVGQRYYNSYRGYDDTGDDLALHNYTHRIVAGLEKNEKDVMWVWHGIRFRMGQIAMADRYLEIMGVPKPLGKTCLEFQTFCLEQQVDEETYDKMWRMIVGEKVFPGGINKQGRPFSKGIEYLIAAFWYAKMDSIDVGKALMGLAGEVSREVSRLKHMVVVDFPEERVKDKRRMLWDLWGQDMPEDDCFKCRCGGRHFEEGLSKGGSRG